MYQCAEKTWHRVSSKWPARLQNSVEMWSDIKAITTKYWDRISGLRSRILQWT